MRVKQLMRILQGNRIQKFRILFIGHFMFAYPIFVIDGPFASRSYNSRSVDTGRVTGVTDNRPIEFHAGQQTAMK